MSSINAELISHLRQLEMDNDVRITDERAAVLCRLRSGAVEVTLTIPHQVLEWWIEARQAGERHHVQDWCDYAGYDDSSEELLAKEMKADVLAFVDAAMSRPLRFAADGKSLQWTVHGQWLQAVPLSAMLPPG